MCNLAGPLIAFGQRLDVRHYPHVRVPHHILHPEVVDQAGCTFRV